MRRRNPYYGEPISATMVGLGVLAGALGIGLGGSAAVYVNTARELARIKDYDGMSKNLNKVIKGLEANELTFEDVRTTPTFMVLSPVSQRQAQLQSSYYLMQAGAQLQGQERDQVLSAAMSFWDKSEDGSETITDAKDPKIQEPLTAAVQILANLPNARTIEQQITMLQKHKIDYLISDQQEYELENFDPSMYVKDALKQTGSEIATPFAIAAGLLTGKKPMGMTKKQWNLIRFSIYGGLGLFLVGYAGNALKPLFELLPDEDDD